MISLQWSPLLSSVLVALKSKCKARKHFTAHCRTTELYSTNFPSTNSFILWKCCLLCLAKEIAFSFLHYNLVPFYYRVQYWQKMTLGTTVHLTSNPTTWKPVNLFNWQRRERCTKLQKIPYSACGTIFLEQKEFALNTCTDWSMLVLTMYSRRWRIPVIRYHTWKLYPFPCG